LGPGSRIEERRHPDSLLDRVRTAERMECHDAVHATHAVGRVLRNHISPGEWDDVAGALARPSEISSTEDFNNRRRAAEGAPEMTETNDAINAANRERTHRGRDTVVLTQGAAAPYRLGGVFPTGPFAVSAGSGCEGGRWAWRCRPHRARD
jgi:hypothetical protein